MYFCVNTFANFKIFCREIDLAFLRRFERKILVDLPESNERIKLIQHFLPSSVAWTSEENETLIQSTAGLTGAEIRIACKEASLKKVKQMIQESNGNGLPTALSNT